MPVPLKTSPWGPEVFPPEWTLSAWQRSVRGDPLTNWGENDLLPETADVVIIGSGISGGTIAHGLLNSPDRPGSVVVLEAREICSGASGRNAGHCRPDAFRGCSIYKRLHGAEQAKKILKSESITFEQSVHTAWPSAERCYQEANNILSMLKLYDELHGVGKAPMTLTSVFLLEEVGNGSADDPLESQLRNIDDCIDIMRKSGTSSLILKIALTS